MDKDHSSGKLANDVRLNAKENWPKVPCSAYNKAIT